MEWLISFVESPCCSNLLFALLQSLWQGAVIAAVLYLFFRTKFPKGENARYIAGIVAMAVLVLCVLLTFSILNFQSDSTTITRSFDGVNQQGNIAAIESLNNITQPESIEVQNVSEEHLTTSVSPARKADLNWKPPALTLWFAGVVIMLLRAMYLIAGGAKLKSECYTLEDERVLAIVESLGKKMNITRKIRVAVSEQISIPGVIGFVRSILFLPASMLGGMPADALEAILAHELAHIKRYDYLVNFCQMVVEAMLFFNPAVWWISRQIRIEREVCCDNAGIAAIGRRIRYAEILVGWAEKLRQPDMELSTVAMGFGSPDTCSPMAERIKRIVTTDHKPALKVPWHIAGMTLLLSFIAIGCLWMGADVTVAVAEKILSPDERIDRITEISQDYGRHVYDYGEDEKILISGTIRTWDGQPLPGNTSISLRVENKYGGKEKTIDISTDGPLAETGTFNQEIGYGTVYIHIIADDYAPIYVGPLCPEVGENIEGVEYILQKSCPVTIKVVDANNEPVEKVKITASYHYSSLGGLDVSVITDTNGIATIENMTNVEALFNFEADGFEPDGKNLILKPDTINVIQLTSSKETNGIVVSKATGEPVAGAKLLRAHLLDQGSNSGRYRTYGLDCEPETVTDENGSFRLRKLSRYLQYNFLVEAEGYMRQYLNDVEAGTDHIMVELGPEKSIAGKITGDLEKLKKDENDTPVVTYVEWEAGSFGGCCDSKEANVIIEEGIGYFEVEKCPWLVVKISAGETDVIVDVNEADLDNVLIDLGPEVTKTGEEVTKTREVVLKFDVPEDEPNIEGMVSFFYERLDDTLKWANLVPAEIVDNQARIDIPAPVPGKFSCFFKIENGNRPVGYWFVDTITIDIPDGNEPYVIEIPVFSAGAVYGTIRRPDGTIIENAQASVKDVEKSEATEQRYDGIVKSPVAYKGTFNVTPIPLDGKYGIIAYEGNSYGVSELIEINEKNPIVNIDVEVPEGVDINGRLVDADGNPVRNTVEIGVVIERGKISYKASGPDTWPDEDGRFVFENVNPGPYGKCFLFVQGVNGFQPAIHEVKDLSEPILIQLKDGLRATGVVIDEDTGLPIPEVWVVAIRKINQNGNEIYERINAEAATNEKGEFVFACMSEGTYLLMSSVSYGVEPTCEITAGQEEPAIFKVSIDDNGLEKP